MLEIDGSHGGGQVLRIALGMATVTQTGFRMENIRGNRDNPGLKEQHLQGVNTIAEICNATVDGAEQGSQELVYKPGDITNHTVSTRIRTAGSVGLLFQTVMLLPTVLDKPLTVDVEGGATFGKWAPTIYYLQDVLLPLLNHSGYNAEISVERHGFYPEGNAHTRFTLQPWDPHPSTFDERGDIDKFTVRSLATDDLQSGDVAERQTRSATQQIRLTHPDTLVETDTQYYSATSTGTGTLVTAHCNNTVLGGDAVGEQGKPAESIGEIAATTLVEDVDTDAAVDRYAADQLIPFLALAGGTLTIPKRTDHVDTVLSLVRQFDADLSRDGNTVSVNAPLSTP